MSPLGAWALALGTSIGWGSLVVTSNSYLLQAGPLGSVIGIMVGTAIMIIMSRNYHYMISRYPDAGGAYSYAKETYGHDYGVLAAWFLVLTYAAVFWANATSLPLFARYFLGDIFQFGSMYTIFGYHVYLGEILLTVAFIVLAGLVCAGRRNLAVKLLIGMVILFSVLITVCFAGALIGHGGSGLHMSPAMIPGENELMQVVRIACISPWAFIGFENISHAAEEFTFPRTKVFRILVAAVISTMLLYGFVVLLSVTAYPPQYDSWFAYLQDLGNLSGIEALPPFYAVQYYMGSTGVFLLLLALLALIFTSLIGNTLALSRLLYALAKDNILPARFSQINRQHVPGTAILLLVIVSLIVPFLGRTAVGWIVDVTSIGATLVYCMVSASTLKAAQIAGDRRECWTGGIGMVLMVLMLLYILLPDLFGSGSMEAESYLLFTVWAILGFLFFRGVLRRDQARNFGRSIIVWIALLALIFFTSLVWMGSAYVTSADNAVSNVRNYWSQETTEIRTSQDEEQFIETQMNGLRASNRAHMAVVVLAFAISLGMLLSNYALINRRMEENEAALAHATSMANTDPLTGVKSKRAFVQMERSIEEAIQEDESYRFAVAACDVNGLKHVNDTLGHKAGDEYICEASRMICELFQHSPVFRTGGDEFTVILTGRDYEERNYIMRLLHERSAENIGLGRVVVAGGLSEYVPGEDDSFRKVFERADTLMYEEKAALKALGAITRG